MKALLEEQVNVRVFKRVKVGKTWRNCSLATDAKHRIRWDHVMVNGREELHREGNYYIEWWDNGKKKQRAVGGNTPSEVTDAVRDKSVELTAVRRGLIDAPKHDEKVRIPMEKAVTDYLEIFENRILADGTGLRTFRTYRPTMELFLKTCRKVFVDELEDSDARHFVKVCYADGNGPRTAYNKLVTVATFAKHYGVAKLVKHADWPKWVRKKIPIYTNEELEEFFARCSERDKTLFRAFLYTGFREQEMKFFSWADLDAKNMTVSVTAKPHLSFRPKNYEERVFPVKDTFVEELLAFKPKSARPFDVVFPSSTGNPDGGMIETVKAIAYKANLNCGRCHQRHKLKDGTIRVNRCAEGPHCSRWFLHKFRHTWATSLLQQGVIDVYTLKDWLGHKDLNTTMVYLEALSSKEAHIRLKGFNVAGD